uniref:Uncharacterized protein n=1 Tax=Arundo donax TaxID=35708 RepID=A0A0A8ZZ62_ARUDO
MTTKGHAACAVDHYLRHGPMAGVFKVRGGDLDEKRKKTRMDLDFYGDTTDLEAILFLSYQWSDIQQLSHLVTISGFGLQETCPFWEFQNTYGPQWRGPARGYGQLYALHLIELYGFKLANKLADANADAV